MYCILVPTLLHYPSLNCYPCPCHLLLNELLNLTRCLVLLRILISVARKDILEYHTCRLSLLHWFGLVVRVCYLLISSSTMLAFAYMVIYLMQWKLSR